MTEKFIGQEFFSKGAAIQRQHGPLFSSAVQVDKVCKQLLACARFAGNDDVGVCYRYLFRHLNNLLHEGVGGYDLRSPLKLPKLFPEPDIFIFQPFFLQSLLRHLSYLVQLERFGNIMICASFHGTDGGINRGITGDHDHLSVRLQLL